MILRIFQSDTVSEFSLEKLNTFHNWNDEEGYSECHQVLGQGYGSETEGGSQKRNVYDGCRENDTCNTGTPQDFIVPLDCEYTATLRTHIETMENFGETQG